MILVLLILLYVMCLRCSAPIFVGGRPFFGRCTVWGMWYTMTFLFIFCVSLVVQNSQVDIAGAERLKSETTTSQYILNSTFFQLSNLVVHAHASVRRTTVSLANYLHWCHQQRSCVSLPQSANKRSMRASVPSMLNQQLL